jgi:hypothetical protein
MQERSEEQIISKLLDLENDGQAERRAELTGERFLSLIHDPDSGHSYILRHGVDDTEGAEIPEDSELYEYPTSDSAQRAYAQLLKESRRSRELVDEDSVEDLGDSGSGGPEMLDTYAADDTDEQITEEEEKDEPTEP